MLSKHQVLRITVVLIFLLEAKLRYEYDSYNYSIVINFEFTHDFTTKNEIAALSQFNICQYFVIYCNSLRSILQCNCLVEISFIVDPEEDVMCRRKCLIFK